MDELKPCPFCDSTEVYQEHNVVRCDNCGCQSPEKEAMGTGVDVYENWNRRPEEKRLIAKLRKMIRLYRVDDQAWNPEEEADRLLEKELGKNT